MNNANRKEIASGTLCKKSALNFEDKLRKPIQSNIQTKSNWKVETNYQVEIKSSKMNQLYLDIQIKSEYDSESVLIGL